MTKQEVLDALKTKLDANMAEVRRQLEFMATLPGHEVHVGIEGTNTRVDLLQKLSTTWKEGQALRELAIELVGLVYGQDPPPDTQPAPVLQ